MKKIVDWRNIYLLPRKTTGNINLCVFQNNILNNVLYLNKKLLTFRKVKSALYSFRSFGKLSIGISASALAFASASASALQKYSYAETIIK